MNAGKACVGMHLSQLLHDYSPCHRNGSNQTIEIQLPRTREYLATIHEIFSTDYLQQFQTTNGLMLIEIVAEFGKLWVIIRT